MIRVLRILVRNHTVQRFVVCAAIGGHVLQIADLVRWCQAKSEPDPEPPFLGLRPHAFLLDAERSVFPALICARCALREQHPIHHDGHPADNSAQGLFWPSLTPDNSGAAVAPDSHSNVAEATAEAVLKRAGFDVRRGSDEAPGFA